MIRPMRPTTAVATLLVIFAALCGAGGLVAIVAAPSAGLAGGIGTALFLAVGIGLFVVGIGCVTVARQVRQGRRSGWLLASGIGLVAAIAGVALAIFEPLFGVFAVPGALILFASGRQLSRGS
jgi:uncharacterized membrane protein HdeD (DUF308 family)